MDKTRWNGRKPRGELNGIGERLEAVREAHMMNRTEFAENAGLNYQTMRNFCAGTRVPDAAEIKMICEAFGLSADWLLGIEEQTRRVCDAEAAKRQKGREHAPSEAGGHA